jgi:hypothetical protein
MSDVNARTSRPKSTMVSEAQAGSSGGRGGSPTWVTSSSQPSTRRAPEAFIAHKLFDGTVAPMASLAAQSVEVGEVSFSGRSSRRPPGSP